MTLPANLDPTDDALIKTFGSQTYLGFNVIPVQTFDHEHSMVHAGFHYQTSEFSAAVGTGSNKDYLIQAPTTIGGAVNNIGYHLIFDGDATGEVLMTIFENCTVSNNGTPLTIYNNNRNSLNASSLLVYSTPTVSATGNAMINFLLGSGSSSAVANNAAVNNRNQREFILANGLLYLLRYHVQGSGSSDICMRLSWYST